MPTMALPRERKSARITAEGREGDPRRGWKSITEPERERESETGRAAAGRQERARKREYQEAEAAA